MATIILFTIVSLCSFFFPAVMFLSRSALVKEDLFFRVTYAILGSILSAMFIYWSGFMTDVMFISMK